MSDKPGYLFQTSIQIGERMALTVSGNLPLEASAKDIEKELDRIFDAMEKQEKKRSKYPFLLGCMKDQRDGLARAKKRYEELCFQEQGRKLTTAEKAAKETCQTQIERIALDLEEAERKLDEMKQEMEKEAA